jgi:hypothetical protein
MWMIILASWVVALSGFGISHADDKCNDPNCCGELYCPPPSGNGGVVFSKPNGANGLDSPHSHTREDMGPAAPDTSDQQQGTDSPADSQIIE